MPVTGGMKEASKGVSVYNSANWTIADSTWTTLTFDSEARDDSGFHSTVSNTSRLTIPAGMAGWYAYSFGVVWASNPTGRRGQNVVLNGTTWLEGTLQIPPAAVSFQDAFAGVRYFDAGDYLEIYVYQSSGGNLVLTCAAEFSGYFRLAKL